MLGGIEEGGKKQMHLIYSSIRMEINGLCLSDTPPLSTHRFLLFSYHRNSAHCKCKVDTGGGRRVPLLRLNTVIRVYSNDMITHLKIKKDYRSSENPWSQKCRCETRLEQFVYEEDGLRCRLAAVKFYRAYSGVQYGRHDRTACLCPSPNETGGFAPGFIGCLLTF